MAEKVFVGVFFFPFRRCRHLPEKESKLQRYPPHHRRHAHTRVHELPPPRLPSPSPSSSATATTQYTASTSSAMASADTWTPSTRGGRSSQPAAGPSAVVVVPALVGVVVAVAASARGARATAREAAREATNPDIDVNDAEGEADEETLADMMDGLPIVATAAAVDAAAAAPANKPKKKHWSKTVQEAFVSFVVKECSVLVLAGAPASPMHPDDALLNRVLAQLRELFPDKTELFTTIDRARLKWKAHKAPPPKVRRA